MIKHILLFIFIFLPLHAHAQEAFEQVQDSDQPIEISAQNSLEWLRNEEQYAADGDVVVTQGDITLKTDQLLADYVGGESNTDITMLTATGNVILENQESVLVGDKATYNVKSGQAIITGENLKLTTPQQVVTAQERMEYNTQTNIARAIGNAKIVNEGNTLQAKTIEATFSKENEDGNLQLSKATAKGGVTITTKNEVLTGNEGFYNAIKNEADIIGNVVIKRGKNSLEGAKAKVNLTTNVSELLGGAGPDGRVKGIFYPKEKSAP